jgi:hypothetical protein
MVERPGRRNTDRFPGGFDMSHWFVALPDARSVRIRGNY